RRSSADLLRLRKQALATNSDTLNVTLTLEDGTVYPHKGRLELTEVAVNESTGSVTLRSVFPNPDHVLLPGMFVRAKVDEGVMQNAILAPQQGITRDVKGNATALIVTSDNKVERRSVVTAETAGSNWLIASGLQSGDRLLVEGSDKVAAGNTVKPVEVQLTGGTD
ncbi:efflux RND transporter periplasmic adaptor subunit, partial [Lonsdalea quercina]|uniref:efflux RND transporter periplasmic adaptor subunit n=1 Tax=Lonsdalea quercina TaxID=71657 RepID=UPI003F448930